MKKIYVAVTVVLSVLTAISLILDIVVISGLVEARRIALDSVHSAHGVVEEASQATLSYTLDIAQEIPVAVSVPIRQDVTIPIQATLPLSMVVSVPINAGLLGTFDIDVPVRTLIPIDVNVTIPVSETLDISTSVPLSVSIPVEIPIPDTPLKQYLDEFEGILSQMEQRLQWPVGASDSP